VETYFTDYLFPVWSRVIGWSIFVILITPLFFWAVKAYIESPAETIKKKLVNISSPSMLWGPALEVHRLDLINSQSTEVTQTSTRRAYDKSRSPVKGGKDIGGLDSIFSATVGNNVLVKMATDSANNNKKSPFSKQSSKAQLKEIAPSSADMLAKRLDGGSGGPIMFEEDGETYMLVPRRKNKPPTVDKCTQTSPYKRKDNSQIIMENSAYSPLPENFTIDIDHGVTSPVQYHSHINEGVEDDVMIDEGLQMHPIPEVERRTSNPIIVIETTSN